MKWNRQQFLFGATGIMLALFLANCSGARSKKAGLSEGTAGPYPVGVDSALAAEVDSLSRTIFVNWERQQQARVKFDVGEQQFEESNQMWLALMSLGDISAIENKDSLEAIRQFNNGAQQLIALRELQQKGNLDENAFKKQSLVLMDSARSAFEQSVRLNPFDRNSRLWLSRVYQMEAERYLQNERLTDAAQTLEKLIQMDKSQHGLYGRLGQIYMSQKKWDHANQNFRSAEEVLRNTAVFQVPEGQEINDTTTATALDSSTLFLYVYYQGESNIRRYNSELGLNDLERALTLARSEEDRRTIAATIEWIRWDDGNIRSAEERDKLLRLIDKQQYEEAAKGFDRLILSLKSGRAARETEWRLALLEFTYLGQQDQAMERMKKITAFYMNDASGAALSDTLYKDYYNSYGAMCHNLGLATLKKKKLRDALIYFTQACAVPWDQRAKSYVEIAKLSINNPERAAEAAAEALANRNQLSREEQLEALRMMIESLKRLGKFKEATEYYREYRQLTTMLN